MSDYQPPELAVDRIAAEWNRVFNPPLADAVEEPEAESAELEPVGKSSVIPSAGHTPGELTADQQKNLTKRKTNTEMLADMLANQNTAYQWYGPQH
ncbi:hypothetical protein M1247_21930 [Mycobacterium sp. 21AC1]|uniref:hypothetical protein n=1 Tax=[Mycobacterium] appelbergii TaxID=2939269 RepID=UPI002938F46B|nr:hypothetical protein [Mycobacterium sp. 21AC1]MDV3127601.1 hypothetical protein [Mycobacterium sp. 21AC1]